MKRWIALPAVAAIVAFAVACGGDDPPPAPTAAPEATATSTPVATATATPTATPEPTPTATATPEATPTVAPTPTAAPPSPVGDYLTNVCEPRDIALDDAMPIGEALAALEAVNDRWHATVPPEGLEALHDLTLSTMDGIVHIIEDRAREAPDSIYGDSHWAVISVINVYADLVRETYAVLPPDVRAEFEDQGCDPIVGANIAELDDYLSHVCSLTGLEVSSATPLDEAVAEYRAMRQRWRETEPPEMLLEHHEISLAMLDGVIRALEEAERDPDLVTFDDAHDPVFAAMDRYRSLLEAVDSALPDPVRAEFIAMGCSTGSIPLRKPAGGAGGDLAEVDEYLSHVCGLTGLTLSGSSPLEEALRQYYAMRERWRSADPPEVLLEHQEVSLAMLDALIRVLEEADRDPERTVLADAFGEAFAVMSRYGDPLTDVFDSLPLEVQNEFRVMGCVNEPQ